MNVGELTISLLVGSGFIGAFVYILKRLVNGLLESNKTKDLLFKDGMEKITRVNAQSMEKVSGSIEKLADSVHSSAQQTNERAVVTSDAVKDEHAIIINEIKNLNGRCAEIRTQNVNHKDHITSEFNNLETRIFKDLEKTREVLRKCEKE